MSGSTLNIDLTQTEQKFLETEAAAAGYSTVGEYVRALIQAVQATKGKAELESKLLQGIASGPSVPLEEHDWDDIRRQVHHL